ncbi:hypothetical protein ACQEWB_49755 [Streptomyces sp. CA-249302]|uniref:hypothetical protein n=1 Tax=Streptomyces sp. CA-249302 TaxID=3240058 RepID=UPI003D90F609
MSDEAVGTSHHPDSPPAGGAELLVLDGELARFERLLAPGVPKESAAERAGRHARDAEVVEILRAQGFAGPLFERFTGQLMEYAWPVLLDWTGTGEIFRQARSAGCPVPARLIIPQWSQDDRYEVVTDSVLDGLQTFRDNALAGGRWNPAKGAALTTYYVGACVFAFRKVYEAWSKQYTAARRSQPCTGLDGDPVVALPDQRAADPCHTAVVHGMIDRVLPLLTTPELRAAVAWHGAGWTQEEAAEFAGLSVKAFQGRLARVRTKAREQHSRRGSAMTSQTGGAMDVNPVAIGHDAFDALLDASSLGAPRVQAVRRLTPTAVRDLLAFRRGLPAADAPARPAPLREQVAEAAQPLLSRAGEEQGPRQAPGRSGSHHNLQIKSNESTKRVNVSATLQLDLYQRFLNRLKFSTQFFTGSAEIILEDAFLEILSSCWKEAIGVAEASMKTRLFRQLLSSEQGRARIGLYGVGVKSAPAYPFNCEETWRSGTPAAGLPGSGRPGYMDGNWRVHTGWPHGFGRNLTGEGSEVARHRCGTTCRGRRLRCGSCQAALETRWLLGRAHSRPSTRDVGRQTGQRRTWGNESSAPARPLHSGPQRRDARWWEETDADARARDWLAAVWISGPSGQGRGRGSGRQRPNSGDERRTWLDFFFTLDGPGVPVRSHAVPPTAWAFGTGSIGWPVDRTAFCQGMAMGLACVLRRKSHRRREQAVQPTWATGFSEQRCPARQQRPLGTLTAITCARLDDRMPVLPPGLVRTGLSRTWGQQVPLPLALAAELLLWTDGGTGVTSAARRIQTAQEAVTEREAAERMLLTGYFRIAVPGAPYALSAVPEGLPGQQTV